MSDLAPSTFLTKIIDCIKSEEEGGFENIFHILTDPTSKKGMTVKQVKDFVNLVSAQFSQDIGKAADLETAQQRIQQLESEAGDLASARARIAELEGAQLSTQLEVWPDDHLEAVQQPSAELIEARKRITELEEEAQQPSAELVEARKRITELEEEAQQHNAELEEDQQPNTELVEARRRITELEEDLKSAHERNVELDESLEAQITKSKDADKVFAEYMNKAINHDNMVEKVKKVEALNTKLEARITELESAINMIHDRTCKIKRSSMPPALTAVSAGGASAKASISGASYKASTGGDSVKVSTYGSSSKVGRSTPQSSSARGRTSGGGMAMSPAYSDIIHLDLDDEDDDRVKSYDDAEESEMGDGEEESGEDETGEKESGEEESDDDDEEYNKSEEESDDTESDEERSVSKGKRKRKAGSSSRKKRRGGRYVTPSVIQSICRMARHDIDGFKKYRKQGKLSEYAKKLLREYAADEDLPIDTFISRAKVAKVVGAFGNMDDIE